MPAEGAPAGLAIHASAVAIGGRALLIAGRSGTGKSRLATALVAASTRERRIELVGDDRVLLVQGARGLAVRPHPRIAGFIERRGLGIVAVAWCGCAMVAGLAILGNDAAPVANSLQNLATISLVDVCEAAHVEAVLDWWVHLDMEASRRLTKPGPKLSDYEDWNW